MKSVGSSLARTAFLCMLMLCSSFSLRAYQAYNEAMQAPCQDGEALPPTVSYRGGNSSMAVEDCGGGLTITLNDLSAFTYTGKPQAPQKTVHYTFTPADATVSFAYGESGDAPVPVNPGTYAVVATIRLGDLSVDFASGTMTINDRELEDCNIKVYTTEESNVAAFQSPLETNRIVYVKPGAASTYGAQIGRTFDNPYPNLREALVYAGSQKALEIRVAAATYTGTYTIPANVQLVGGYAANATGTGVYNPAANVAVIDGQGQGRVLTQAGNNSQTTRIDGFIIKGGNAAEGGAVLLAGNGLLDNCIIRDNTAVNGGGVKLLAGSRAVNCELYGNTATTRGAGAYVADSAVLTHSVLHTNSGPEALYNQGHASNVLLFGNTADGIVNNGAGAQLNHVTVADNKNGAGIVNTAGAVANAISYGNAAQEAVVGCYTADPLFFGGSDPQLKYQLLENSPCVDASAGATSGTDLLGNMRSKGAVNKSDMGAYELFQVTTPTDEDRPKPLTAVVKITKDGILSLNTELHLMRLVMQSAADKSASLMLVEDVQLTASTVVVQKAMTAGNWNLLSLPFEANIAAITDTEGRSYTPGQADGQLDIRSYDGKQRSEQNKSYAENSPYWTPVTDKMKAFEGYIIHLPEAATLCFTASAPYSSTAAATITLDRNSIYHTNEGKLTDKENMGWNFRGIPYLNAYDFTQISRPFILYAYNNDTWDAIELWQQSVCELPVFSAYFLQTATFKDKEVIHFPAASQGGGIAAQAAVAMTPAFTSEKARLDIVVKGAGYEDKTKLVIDEQASLNYEPNTDALKFMSFNPVVPQLYSVGPGGYGYAINVRPDNGKAVPLAIHIGKVGNYNIGLGNEQWMGSYTSVYLIDKLLKQRVDLLCGNYAFRAAEVALLDNRFEIQLGREYRPDDVEEDDPAKDENDCPEIKYYINGHTLFVHNITLPATMALYDLQGNVLVSRRVYFEQDYIDLKNDYGVFLLSVNTPCKSTVVKFLR